MQLTTLANALGQLQRSLPDVYRHSLAVAKLGMRVGRGWLESKELETLVIASLLHDLGKLALPVGILTKPGPLDAAEWQAIKRHPAAGAKMVSALGFPLAISQCVQLHHERWDGRGYLGISGPAVPLVARLLTICDSWEAMTSPRPYQAAKSFAVACKELGELSGRQFDPVLVRLFLKTFEQDVKIGLNERMEIERKWIHSLASTYRDLAHPVVLIQSRCLDELVVTYMKTQIEETRKLGKCCRNCPGETPC